MLILPNHEPDRDQCGSPTGGRGTSAPDRPAGGSSSGGSIRYVSRSFRCHALL
jgi:hypothetical protein